MIGVTEIAQKREMEHPLRTKIQHDMQALIFDILIHIIFMNRPVLLQNTSLDDILNGASGSVHLTIRVFMFQATMRAATIAVPSTGIASGNSGITDVAVITIAFCWSDSSISIPSMLPD
jgi:hypothetical protein